MSYQNPAMAVLSAFALLLPAEPAFSADATGSETLPAFYVRGDFGYAWDDVGSFGQANLIRQGGSFLAQEFGSAPYIGGGIGWRFTDWLRFDVTGEYRFSADVDAQDHLQRILHGPDGLLTASTTYQGEYTAIVGLANLYVDLPKWQGIAPYVGAGLGIASNRFSNFTLSSNGSFRDFATGEVTSATSPGTAGNDAQAKLAWALMAGVTIDIDDNLKLDAGYRYLNLGSDLAVTTGLIDCRCGTIGQPITASDVDAHEFRIGLRWEFATSACK